jgi:hypothetical protein
MAIIEAAGKAAEARGRAFLNKAKGLAVVMTAISGLAIGILSYLKDTRDPKVKAGYTETSDRIVEISRDIHRLTEIVRQQASEIQTLQNWVISQQSGGSSGPLAKITASVITQQVLRPRVPTPTRRAPRPWATLPAVP